MAISADPANDDFSSRLTACGVVPVLVIDDATHAAPLAEALLAGGLRCAEITFRTPAAARALAIMRGQFPDVWVGAGTVLSVEQADAAIEAGAQFVVSPGTNPAVVDHVMGRGVPMLPGVATPSEVEAVLARDIQLAKFFPSEPFGGVGTLRALAGPYPTVRFVPTGGITIANLATYLRLSNVAACGGSWMATREQISRGSWNEIRRASAETAAVIERERAAVRR